MNSRTGPSTLVRRLLGLALVAVVLAFVAFTVAAYNKAFTPIVALKLKADKAGNQLLPQADVKVRGVLVGEVRTITPAADGAELSLAIEPDKAKMLPANMTFRLLPKTLFGDRFVALQIPAQREGELRSGQRIYQDRSRRATELDEALNNLMPVLQAVQPQKLSATLHAVSTALRDRGKPLGSTLSQLGRYLGELNPELPTLTKDLRTFTQVAATYSDALPDLSNALADLTVTSRTIASQRTELQSLFDNLTGTSQNLQRFLEVNRNNLISVAADSRPTLRVLAKYSPEYPCFFAGLAETVRRSDKVFGKGTKEKGLHLTVELVTNRGKYVPGKDDPFYADQRGPKCYDPSKFPVPFPQFTSPGPLQDGASEPPASRQTTADPLLNGATPASYFSTGLINSRAEHTMINELFSGELQRSPGDMPSWSSALLGPLVRGTEVKFA